MSIHGRSIFQYFNETDEVWIPIPVGDLVSVEYADRVYTSATAEIIISNKDMNKTLSADANASTGTYSVEGAAIDTPTFHRYQQIRLLHMPRPLTPKKVVHDNGYANRAGDSQAIFTLSSHGMAVGTYVQIVNEECGVIPDDLYRVDTVPTSSTFTLDKRGTSSAAAAQTYTTSLPGQGVSGSKAAYIQYRSDKALYPYFYGKIDSLDVSYSDAIGKTIHIEASDYLRSLQQETVTKAITNSTPTTRAFTDSRMEQGDGDEDADEGKFRDSIYKNTRLSATVKEIMQDWSVGKDLFADNTYDGSTLMGVTKFDDSSYVYGANDKDKNKSYKNTKTTALQAMKSVAMTDPHWSEGTLSHLVGVYYGSSGSLLTSGTRDVLLVYGGTGGVGATAHNYKNGNLIEISNHNPVGSPTPTTIASGTYIVHSKTANDLKLKFLDGGVVQSVANTATSTSGGTPSSISAGPASTGHQGYDFYLDAGLYGDIPLDSNTHRPHLNYFMRKTRPIDPGATGLSAVYPSDDNMADDDTAFGTKGYDQTKVFILNEFDHGLFEEDLYSQIALQAVDTEGMAKTRNNLGHKLEMLKVNSIANSDYVANLSSNWQKYSGDTYGNGLFHWNRADDARAYGWYSTTDSGGDGLADAIDTATEVNIINAKFFASNAAVDAGTLYAEAKEKDYASQGTFGVLEEDHGGFRRGEVTGIAGYSALPRGGRSLTQPTTDSTAGESGGGKFDDFRDVNDISHAINLTNSNGDRIKGIDMGAEAVASANLIKDIYWCEQEGLLGTEVTASHNGSASAIIVNLSNHGLETGCLIKVTDIGGTTSGTNTGVKVNTSPEAPTTSNTTTGSRDNGSYFRVDYIDANTFYITVPQKHKIEYREADGSQDGEVSFSSTVDVSDAADAVFKYKRVFNVFKEACRVQWQSGSSWTTKEDELVLDSDLVKGAQQILISDVAAKDRPYMGMEVNTLVAGHVLPGQDFTDNLKHPTHHFDSGTTEATSYFGFSTVPFCLQADFAAGGASTTRANVDRYGTNSNDDVRVMFRYGDHISETRFLYGDAALTGVVGRDRSATGGGANKTSNDVFKTVTCKVLERFATKRSVSRTYNLNFNESVEAPDAARNAAAAILKRVILPAQRTTFKIFGYPTIKLVGQGQSGSSGNSLVPTQNFGSYGGRAGMLIEQLASADGVVEDSTLVQHLNTSTDVVTADVAANWTTSPATYYRAFIHLRSGMSIRVEHPAAGVIGNHIITGLKYNERGGNTSTMISTTGYDEAVINLRHGNLANAIQTVAGTANQDVITITDSEGYALALANIQFDDSTTTLFYQGDPTS
tara:strand:- start:6984 stop:10949 length:3966 start_codon:yes stop_codon:yes gene_type:complete